MTDSDDKIPGIDPEILARAEQAVAALGGNFVDQTKMTLDAHRTQLEEMTELPQGDMLRDVFSFAHDLRGQEGSFGYPLLSSIGGSLCAFLEARDFRLTEGDAVVLRSHFDAAAAILADEIGGEGDAISQALVTSLSKLVDKRLRDTA